MPLSQPSIASEVLLFRPACSKCGAPTTLARIEPALQRGHDLRTFECTVCSNADTVDVAYEIGAQ